MKKLSDLVSVGPATLKDFDVLGIKTLKQLAKQDAHALYLKLCKRTGHRHDPCAEDVFAAAIAQAQDPHLPKEQKQWFYWSHVRKKRKQRCDWVPVGNTVYEKYHDEEWGVPVHDDRIFFEFLILEGAQAGLSWETILKRREGYRKAFAHFDWKKVAAYDQKMIEKLMRDPGIIRNRKKIEAAVNNACCFSEICEEFGSFNTYVWRFKTAKTLSQDLQKRGFRFVGLNIICAFMQAVGLINDHAPHCFRFQKKA